MIIFQLLDSTNFSHLCKVDTKKTGLSMAKKCKENLEIWSLPNIMNFTNFHIEPMYSAKIEFLADVSSTLDGDLLWDSSHILVVLHTSWGKRCGYSDVYHFMAGLQKVPKKLVSDINVWTIYTPRHLQKMETKNPITGLFFRVPRFPAETCSLLGFAEVTNHWFQQNPFKNKWWTFVR